jgi:hypothetical protein
MKSLISKPLEFTEFFPLLGTYSSRRIGRRIRCLENKYHGPKTIYDRICQGQSEL